MHPNIIKMYKERCGEFIFRFFHHTLRKLRASYREQFQPSLSFGYDSNRKIKSGVWRILYRNRISDNLQRQPLFPLSQMLQLFEYATV